MKILLHIGTGKTGSTSIQSFLEANKSRLRDQCVFIPSTLGQRNHRKLPAIVQNDAAAKEYMATLGFIGPNQKQAAKDRWREQFLHEIASAHGEFELCLITAEHLCYLNDAETEQLHRLLSRAFESMRILVYLRNPVDYEVAMYDTALKVGGLRPGPRPPARGGETDYQALLEKWARVFGIENLDVRLFDRDELVQSDIMQDFAQAAELETQGFLFPKSENASLDILGQALLQRINRKLPPYLPDGRPNPRRRQIHSVFEKHFQSGPKYAPDPELLETFQAVLGPSNEWVRSRFFPKRNRLFQDRDAPPQSEPDIRPEELDQIAGLLLELWNRK